MAHEINNLQQVLLMKSNFKKNKVVTGKTPFFVIHFVLPILFVLTLTSWKTVLYGNITLSVLVFYTKNLHSTFLKKVFVFWKIYFNVKVLKTFIAVSDYHMKTCRSFKRRAILKISRTIF